MWLLLRLYRFWRESSAGMHCLCHCYISYHVLCITPYAVTDNGGKDGHRRIGTTESNHQPTNRGTWRAERFVSNFRRSLLAGKDWPKLYSTGTIREPRWSWNFDSCLLIPAKKKKKKNKQQQSRLGCVRQLSLLFCSFTHQLRSISPAGGLFKLTVQSVEED